MRLWITCIVLVSIGELLPRNHQIVRRMDEAVSSDALLHFTAYLILGLLPLLAFLRRIHAIGWALAMILLGALLEVGQQFAPGRNFEWVDLAANAAGVLAGIGIGLAALRLPRYA